jgi:hypothetical protein
MYRFSLVLLFSLLLHAGFAQYNWKLEKEKNGISVYLSDMPGSKFKAIKVECTLAGTYAKLINTLSNVSQFQQWIYNNKLSKIIKQHSPHDFIYYSETHLPFPMSNRDAIIHVRIKTDSLPKFLTIAGSGEPDSFPEIPGKERVHHYKANWRVTMPTPQTLRINYVLEIDPGGSIPAWIANSFAEKGPYGTFLNLAELLKK